MDSVLLTGSAGFIGFHVAKELLERGHKVIGYDNINDYYDINIKESRLAVLRGYSGFTFYRADICDEAALEEVMRKHPDINRVIHLAAQAGVRYSLICPEKYIESNIVDTSLRCSQGSFPKTRIRPLSGFRKPSTHSTAEVFPEPF